MARPLRIEYENAFYHVISRGHRKEEIFCYDDDRRKFLEKLGEAAFRHQVKIHCYVLMSNHYHLLIETPHSNMQKFMHDINASYANWFYHKYQLTGSVFQSRYKAIIVDKDEYLIVLSAYIHLNPVRAGMVKDPTAYEWSSFKSFIGISKPLPFLFVRDILAIFGGSKKYRKYVMNQLQEREEINPEEIYGRNSFLGSQGFVKKVLAKMRNVKKKVSDREIPDVKELRRVDEDIITEMVMRTFKIGEDNLLSKRRGNPYRKMYIYLLRKYTGLSLRQIAEILDMDYSAVSQLARFFSREIDRNIDLKKSVKKVESQIKKAFPII